MGLETLTHDQILTDPYNVRRTFRQGLIEELADSIGEYGLLENLVVRPSTDGEKFWLVAGERRWRAIGELIKQGRWEEEQTIPVLVITSDGKFENLVENMCREAVRPWELGFRFSELIESNYTQQEIGRKIGRSPSYVSRHIVIAKGLHPATIKILNGMSTPLTGTKLHQLSGIKDADGYPDEKGQREFLAQVMGKRVRGKRKRAVATDTKRFLRRLQHLSDEMKIPRHARNYAEPIIAYLKGQTRTIIWPEEL